MAAGFTHFDKCNLVFLLSSDVYNGVDPDRGPVEDVRDGVQGWVLVAAVNHHLDYKPRQVGDEEDKEDKGQHVHEPLEY